MNCTFAEKVSALVDGELTTNESHAVELHLLECAECRQLRTDFLSLSSQIGNYDLRPAVPMSSRLAQRLSRPAIQNRDSSQPIGFFGMAGRPLLAGAAAMLLIVSLIALVWYARSQHDDSDHMYVVDNRPKAQPSPVPSPGASPQQPPRQANDKDADQEVPPKFRRREVVTQDRPSTRRPQRLSPQPGPEQLAAFSGNRPSSEQDDSPTMAVDTESLNARHVEQSELLLRSFRNVRVNSSEAAGDLGHERLRAEKLFYQNVMLRREADSAGDVELASLLESLEPILLDIANLPKRAPGSEVKAIKDRMERQNLVALLQINSRPKQ